MKRKLSKLILIGLIVFTIIGSVIIALADDFSYDGTSIKKNGNGYSLSNTAFSVQSTNTEKNIIGYRFSVYDKNGNKRGKSVDIINSNKNLYSVGITNLYLYSFGNKTNNVQRDKRQIIQYNSGKSYADITKAMFTVKKMSAWGSHYNYRTDTSIPQDPTAENKKAIQNWLYANNNAKINKIYEYCSVPIVNSSISSTERKLNGDKILIEALYQMAIDNYRSIVTNTEAVMIHGMYAHISDGGSNSDSKTGFYRSTFPGTTYPINYNTLNYTNYYFPAILYATGDYSNLFGWSAASAISGKIRYRDVIYKGYGLNVITYSKSNVKATYHLLGGVWNGGSTTDPYIKSGVTPDSAYTLESSKPKRQGNTNAANQNTDYWKFDGYKIWVWKAPNNDIDNGYYENGVWQNGSNYNIGDTNIDLYAQYSPYSVIFHSNSNGNSTKYDGVFKNGDTTFSQTWGYNKSASAATQKDYNNTTIWMPQPRREGYTFVGWTYAQYKDYQYGRIPRDFVEDGSGNYSTACVLNISNNYVIWADADGNPSTTQNHWAIQSNSYLAKQIRSRADSDGITHLYPVWAPATISYDLDLNAESLADGVEMNNKTGNFTNLFAVDNEQIRNFKTITTNNDYVDIYYTENDRALINGHINSHTTNMQYPTMHTTSDILTTDNIGKYVVVNVKNIGGKVTYDDGSGGALSVIVTPYNGSVGFPGAASPKTQANVNVTHKDAYTSDGRTISFPITKDIVNKGYTKLRFWLYSNSKDVTIDNLSLQISITISDTSGVPNPEQNSLFGVSSGKSTLTNGNAGSTLSYNQRRSELNIVNNMPAGNTILAIERDVLSQYKDKTLFLYIRQTSGTATIPIDSTEGTRRGSINIEFVDDKGNRHPNRTSGTHYKGISFANANITNGVVVSLKVPADVGNYNSLKIWIWMPNGGTFDNAKYQIIISPNINPSNYAKVHVKGTKYAFAQSPIEATDYPLWLPGANFKQINDVQGFFTHPFTYTFKEWRTQSNGRGSAINFNNNQSQVIAPSSSRTVGKYTRVYAEWTQIAANIDYDTGTTDKVTCSNTDVNGNTYRRSDTAIQVKKSGNTTWERYINTKYYNNSLNPTNPTTFGLTRTGYIFTNWKGSLNNQIYDTDASYSVWQLFGAKADGERDSWGRWDGVNPKTTLVAQWQKAAAKKFAATFWTDLGPIDDPNWQSKGYVGNNSYTGVNTVKWTDPSYAGNTASTQLQYINNNFLKANDTQTFIIEEDGTSSGILYRNGFKFTGYEFAGWFAASEKMDSNGLLYAVDDYGVNHVNAAPTFKWVNASTIINSDKNNEQRYYLHLFKNGESVDGQTADENIHVENLTTVDNDVIRFYAVPMYPNTPIPDGDIVPWNPHSYMVYYNADGGTLINDYEYPDWFVDNVYQDPTRYEFTVFDTAENYSKLKPFMFEKDGFVVSTPVWKQATLDDFIRGKVNSVEGWYNEDEITSEQIKPYSDSESFINLTDQDNAIIYMTPNWTSTKGDVIYCGNGADAENYTSDGVLPARACVQGHDINDFLDNRETSPNDTLYPNRYSRVGYKFVGWSTEPGKSDVKYDNDTTFNELQYQGSNDLYLYAQWTPISYTVIYDGNGATSGSVASQNFSYSEEKALNKNSFTKDFYHPDPSICWIAYRNNKSLICTNYTSTSVEWSENDENTTPFIFTDEQQVKNLTSIDGDIITMVAQWVPNKLIVRYNSNGGKTHITSNYKLDSDKFYVEKSSNQIFRQVYTYNEGSEYINLKTIEFFDSYKLNGLESCNFEGWAFDKNSLEPDYNTTTMMALYIPTFADGLRTGDVVIDLYAIWNSGETYSLQYYEGEYVTYDRIRTDAFNLFKNKLNLEMSEDVIYIPSSGQLFDENPEEIVGIAGNLTSAGYTIKLTDADYSKNAYTYFEKIEKGEYAKFYIYVDALGMKETPVTVYIKYNNPPIVKALDRWFSVQDAKAGKITSSELLSTAYADDYEGDVNAFLELLTDDLSSMTAPGTYEVEYYVRDNIPENGQHKEATVTATIHIEDNYTNVGARFIGQEFYPLMADNESGTENAIDSKGLMRAKEIDGILYFIDTVTNELLVDANGNRFAVDAGFKYTVLRSRPLRGADGSKIYVVIPLSKWYTDASCSDALRQTLSNSKDKNGNWDLVQERWYFTSEEIKTIRKNIIDNGLDFSFYNNQFINGHCVSIANMAFFAQTYNLSEIYRDYFDITNGVIEGIKDQDAFNALLEKKNGLLIVPNVAEDGTAVISIADNVFANNPGIKEIYFCGPISFSETTFEGCNNITAAYTFPTRNGTENPFGDSVTVYAIH